MNWQWVELSWFFSSLLEYIVFLVFEVSLDDGEHTADELCPDHVEHRHTSL
jgi:hypothetical protein